MKIEQLEAAIVEIIATLGIPAKAYPEDPSGYLPDAYPGEVLVRYTGFRPTKRDLATLYVEQTQTLEVVFVSQLLRGDNGLYEWLEKVRAKLDGYSVLLAAGYLEITSEDFLDEYNGTWQFGQKWQLKSIVNNEQADPYANDPIGT